MVVRLWRKEKLVCTIPVDLAKVLVSETSQYYEKYSTGVRIAIKSDYLLKKYGIGYYGLCFSTSYGNWRLTDAFEHLLGNRTGVTFTRVEIL